MSVGQMGQTQYLVNMDEQQGFSYLQPGHRQQLQSMKHDLSKNGVYDPQAQHILNQYPVKK